MLAHMTSWIRGTLDERAWTLGGHPLEWKQLDPAAPNIARLRFEPGFSDPNWCTTSHLIRVESGALTLELAEETITLEAGEFIRLRRGTAHRAQNLGSVPVTLFIVSRLEELTE
jgi:quercetin dioxygenase-like cupin family protein